MDLILKWILAIYLCSASIVLAAESEKVIRKDTIMQQENVVMVSMPCNWNKTQAVRLVGNYGSAGEHPMTRAQTAQVARYLQITFDQMETMNLDYVRVFFDTTSAKCADRFGFDSFTR